MDNYNNYYGNYTQSNYTQSNYTQSNNTQSNYTQSNSSTEYTTSNGEDSTITPAGACITIVIFVLFLMRLISISCEDSDNAHTFNRWFKIWSCRHKKSSWTVGSSATSLQII